MEPKLRKIMVPGEISEKSKILLFSLTAFSGSMRGQIRSNKVIPGHLRSSKVKLLTKKLLNCVILIHSIEKEFLSF